MSSRCVAIDSLAFSPAAIIGSWTGLVTPLNLQCHQGPILREGRNLLSALRYFLQSHFCLVITGYLVVNKRGRKRMTDTVIMLMAMTTRSACFPIAVPENYN